MTSYVVFGGVSQMPASHGYRIRTLTVPMICMCLHMPLKGLHHTDIVVEVAVKLRVYSCSDGKRSFTTAEMLGSTESSVRYRS